MKRICMILIVLGIIMGCAPIARADAQESGNEKDTVKVYHAENRNTICEMGHVYYMLFQYERESDNHAWVVGTAPGAPSVLEIPPVINVNGVQYSVTEFETRDYETNYYGLPSNEQVFEEIKLPDSVAEIYLYAPGIIRCKKINLPKYAELNPGLLYLAVDNITLEIPKDHVYYTLKDNFVYDKKDPTKIHYVLDASGDVRIPEGVKYVASLLDNSRITKLFLPSTLERIDKSFAKGAEKLEMVDLSATKLKTIPADAFKSTKSLQEIKLPSTLRTIDSSAFSDSGLRKVVIPKKVTAIGRFAFRSCSKLKKVSFGNKLPRLIENSTFRGTPSGIKFYVRNQKMAKKLKKNLKGTKVKKAKIYAGKKKKLVYKKING